MISAEDIHAMWSPDDFIRSNGARAPHRSWQDVFRSLEDTITIL